MRMPVDSIVEMMSLIGQVIHQMVVCQVITYVMAGEIV